MLLALRIYKPRSLREAPTCSWYEYLLGYAALPCVALVDIAEIREALLHESLNQGDSANTTTTTTTYYYGVVIDLSHPALSSATRLRNVA